MTKRKNNMMPSERRGRDLCGFILGSQPCDLEYRGKPGGPDGREDRGNLSDIPSGCVQTSFGEAESTSLPAPSLTSHIRIF